MIGNVIAYLEHSDYFTAHCHHDSVPIQNYGIICTFAIAEMPKQMTNFTISRLQRKCRNV